MIYLKWLIALPVMLVVTALTFPLALVLPAFAEMREGPLNNGTRYGKGWYLPSWLSWFQTPDNSLDGDNGWKAEHWQWRYKLPAPLCSYVGRVGWLWRNPGYGFGVVYMSGDPIVAGFSGNEHVNDDPGVEGYCLVSSQGLFQFVWVKKIGTDRSIYCNFGWNIKGLVGSDQKTHIATYAFSPRLSKFKE